MGSLIINTNDTGMRMIYEEIKRSIGMFMKIDAIFLHAF